MSEAFKCELCEMDSTKRYSYHDGKPAKVLYEKRKTGKQPETTHAVMHLCQEHAGEVGK
jgi:hypothetical protein